MYCFGNWILAWRGSICSGGQEKEEGKNAVSFSKLSYISFYTNLLKSAAL